MNVFQQLRPLQALEKEAANATRLEQILRNFYRS
jgi:hypothetical protein